MMDARIKAHFPKPLKLEYYPKLEDQFLLLDEFIYRCNDGTIIVCPKGMDTDLASIPRMFRWLFKGHNKYTFGAIPHDELYRLRGKFTDKDGKYHEWSRNKCDRVFKEACENAGVGLIRRNLMYAALVVGGLPAWLDDE